MSGISGKPEGLPDTAFASPMGPLRTGSRIAIVGAGPAGSFFALHAIDIAGKQGKSIDISLIDGKSFRDSGPGGCNMCAGIIGDGLVKKLRKIDIPLTSQVIRQEITGYAIHARGSEARLRRDPGTEIYTVFRGGGPPSLTAFKENISFDQFLLDFVKEQGAEYFPHNVTKINEPKKEDAPASLILDSGVVIEADLIVGAFGVNSPLMGKIPFRYFPPSTWHTCQAEVRWSSKSVKETFKGMVHIFPINAGGVEFIAATPKKEHVTLTAIGTHVKWRDLVEAANASDVKDFLPTDWKMNCHCHPQVPVGPARFPYSDRMVIIGDAGYSRYLKNGIESAYYTGLFAAQTALHHGVGRVHFEKHYDRWCRDMFGMDNVFGRLMFFIHNKITANRYLADAEQDRLLYEQEDSHNGDKKLSSIIWHLFAGELPYRKIMLKSLDADLQLKMLGHLARTLTKDKKDIAPARG